MVWGVIAAAALLSAPPEYNSRAYAAVRVGHTWIKDVGSQELNLRRRTNAGGIVAGYRLTPTAAIELAYDHLYRDTYTLESETAVKPHFTADVTETNISAVVSAPVSARWSLYIRPGYGRTREKIAADNIDGFAKINTVHNALFVGFGGSYYVSKYSFLRLEARSIGEAKDRLNLSVTYAFSF